MIYICEEGRDTGRDTALGAAAERWVPTTRTAGGPRRAAPCVSVNEPADLKLLKTDLKLLKTDLKLLRTMSTFTETAGGHPPDRGRTRLCAGEVTRQGTCARNMARQGRDGQGEAAYQPLRNAVRRCRVVMCSVPSVLSAPMQGRDVPPRKAGRREREREREGGRERESERESEREREQVSAVFLG